jgi:hypothetical protein
MKMLKIAQRVIKALRCDRGDAVLSVALAFILIALATPIILKVVEAGNEQVEAAVVANHMKQVVEASRKYVQANYSSLQAVATPTNAAVVSISDLRAANMLPSTFASENAWGQSYQVYVLEPTPDDLQTLVLTTGGKGHSPLKPQFASTLVPKAAKLIGAAGGFVPTGVISGQPATTLQGVLGGWSYSFGSSNIPNPGAGHLGAMVYLADGVQDQDYLYRVAVPGKPELNRMSTVLDMDGNDIHMGDASLGGGDGEGVKTINFQNHAKAEFSCASTEDYDGLLFFVSKGPEATADAALKSGGLYLCRDGDLRKVYDEGNLDIPSSFPVGGILPWPSATLPKAGNGVYPTQGLCLAAVSETQATERGCEWLIADGSPINPTAYPELSAIVGSVIPDYRGVFLRGHGSVTSGHYGTVVHQSGGLGELQGDTIRNIEGRIGDVSYERAISSTGAFWREPYNSGGASKEDGWYSYVTHLDASLAVPTSAENRPVNRAVTYLIRAR